VFGALTTFLGGYPDSIKKHSSFGYSLQFIYLCISRREMRHVEAIFDKEKTGNFI
jgi:hypothetical protein